MEIRPILEVYNEFTTVSFTQSQGLYQVTVIAKQVYIKNCFTLVTSSNCVKTLLDIVLF